MSAPGTTDDDDGVESTTISEPLLMKELPPRIEISAIPTKRHGILSSITSYRDPILLP
jgi:hypothetical protein